MKKNEVDLKDPLLAAVLAFLVPGLGHLYQGRLFKAAIFAGGILSLYLSGLSLSDWKIVQYRGGPGEPRTELLSFLAQSGVGLPGLFAVNQTRRYRRLGDQVVTSLQEPMTAPFHGVIHVVEENEELEGKVTGEVNLAPAVGRFNDHVIVGKITGTLEDGREVNFSLGEGVRLGSVLQNDPRRVIEGDIVRTEGERELRIGRLTDAWIPRSFWNWFLVPLSHAEEQELHRQLGKYHELALVLTMIAGLLNILAIWDAYDGPAYGYGEADPTGDQPAEEQKRPEPPQAESSREAVSSGAATA